jgi:hypothetical protein
MIRTLWVTSFLFITFHLIPAFNASAAINDGLVRDFAPVSGYVIQSAGSEFLIDLDARQQIAVGDIFSVVRPGEKIIHPVTKVVIGSHDTVKGIFQVTGVKAGFSSCRPIGTSCSIRGGDAIRRFQNLDVYFWDYTGQGEPLFIELQAALPHLQWQGYAVSQAKKPVPPALPASKSPALYFALTDQGLTVYSPDFTPIHSYPTSSIHAPRTALAPLLTPALGENDTVMIKRVVESGSKSFWTSPAMNGTPVGVEVGDFDGDGLQEIATAFEDRIEVYRLTHGKYKQLVTVPFGVAIRAYHLDAFDLKKNSRMQLFVSAVTNSGNLSGMVIEFNDGQYRVTQKDIPWHLRRLTMPVDGAVLLAQKMGIQGREFIGPVFRVALEGTRLVEGAVVGLPPKTNLYNFAPFTAKEQKLFACLGNDGSLNIATPEGQIIGSSVDKMGGSESYLEMNEEVQSGGESRISYIPARIEVNKNGEILVPVNSGFSVLSRVRMFSKSELKAMAWDGSVLREVWHSTPEKSYLADFRLSDANNEGSESLVTFVAYPEYNPFSSRRSAIHVYKLP